MTLLVLGADGQVARELCARAAELGIAARAVRRREVDITDAAQLRAAIAGTAPSLVVNTAAYTNVDRAETDSEAAFAVNGAAPGLVAVACGDAGVPLVHLSTDYVFDGTKPTAYLEDDPVAPINVYGGSKAQGEQAVRHALARHVILRTSWVYGSYGSNFLKTVLRLARDQAELRIIADQRGCPTATIDIADAILAIARRIAGADVPWGTYHFAGSGVTTWHGFASEIVDAQAPVTGRRPAVTAITASSYPQPARRPANSELDSSRFARMFGCRAADWRMRVRGVVAALTEPSVTRQ
jgi:dTDP-4-dehydrorhamnose reductase